jgi:Zn finger protein HypA/HybF involved in hydrogenase expression
MHEMGIASSVLEAVHKELHRYPGQRAVKIVLRIGEYAGVDPESLRFCFDSIVKGSDYERLELEIEWSEATDHLEFVSLELEDGEDARSIEVAAQSKNNAKKPKEVSV